MKINNLFKISVIIALLLAGSHNVVQASSQPGLLWSYPSDESWIGEVTTIGNYGTQIFTEIGAYDNKRLLFSGHDINPLAPVWSDQFLKTNFQQRVDSASKADVFVSMHQEYKVQGNQAREAILRKFTSSNSGHDWTYTFSPNIYNHSWSDVRVTADGTRIVQPY